MKLIQAVKLKQGDKVIYTGTKSPKGWGRVDWCRDQNLVINKKYTIHDIDRIALKLKENIKHIAFPIEQFDPVPKSNIKDIVAYSLLSICVVLIVSIVIRSIR